MTGVRDGSPSTQWIYDDDELVLKIFNLGGSFVIDRGARSL